MVCLGSDGGWKHKHNINTFSPAVHRWSDNHCSAHIVGKRLSILFFAQNNIFVKIFRYAYICVKVLDKRFFEDLYWCRKKLYSTNFNLNNFMLWRDRGLITIGLSRQMVFNYRWNIKQIDLWWKFPVSLAYMLILPSYFIFLYTKKRLVKILPQYGRKTDNKHNSR